MINCTKYLIIFIFLFSVEITFSQNYILNNVLNNSTVNTCSGTFYDSGGANNNYGNNQTRTVTFCSSNPTDAITLSFSQFDLEWGYDFMYIYDGPNTTSPSLGIYTGTTLNGSTIWAPSGCITIVFVSDWLFTNAGWTASIGCDTAPTPPSCITTTPAGNDCATVTPICDFNGYCGNTSNAYSDNSWGSLDNAFCGTLENNSFFSFDAGATSVSLEVWTSNCANNLGVQFMIFSTSGNCSGAVTSYTCENQLGPGYSVVSASGLTIGNTYYLMVDGYAGDECDYIIGANASSGILLPVSLNTNSETICNGSSTTLIASGGDGIYTWSPSNGLNATTGNSVIANPSITTTYTVTSSSGNALCPNASTEQVIVNVNYNTTSTDNVGTHCDSYTWIDGNTYTTTNNTATWTTTNAAGCDNVETLDLIINNSSTSTDNVGTHCYSYTWIDGNTYTATNNTATWTTTNAAGCTHTETLNLIINNSTTSIDNVGAHCDSYTWIDGITYTVSNNSATWITTNPLTGCDNIATLQLIIGYEDDINLVIDKNNISCFGYNDGSIILSPDGGNPPYNFLWDNGSTNQSLFSLSEGSYSFNMTDQNGCTVSRTVNIEEANQIFLDYFIATSPICRYDESALSIHISNSGFNNYIVSLQDSILKSYTIDTNGLLIATGLPIILTPNFSCNPVIISLTDENGCTAVVNDNVHIEVKQLPVLEINEPDICIGTPSFTLVNATPTGGSYKIEGVSTDFFDASNLNPGNYNISYSYTDPITSCSNQTTEILTISESPRAGMIFSPQPANISDPNIFFRDNSNEEVLISEWDLGDGTIIYDDLSFWHTYNDIGSYTIRYYITNLYGCTDSVVKQLNINPNYSTFIPNSFTPNNDGDNDIFYPVSTGFNSYNMKIFDRWGGIIFDEDDLAWDGNTNGKVIGGLYSYSIQILDFKDKPFIYTGLVTLIR